MYYPLGVALAGSIGRAIPGSKTSVQATKASVENLNLLQAGRGEIAFTLGDSLSDAWKGNEESGFKTPLKKLRGIAAIYPNYIQIVARADAGIKTLADLKGKKISVGAPRSGTELNARVILGAATVACVAAVLVPVEIAVTAEPVAAKAMPAAVMWVVA